MKFNSLRIKLHSVRTHKQTTIQYYAVNLTLGKCCRELDNACFPKSIKLFGLKKATKAIKKQQGKYKLNLAKIKMYVSTKNKKVDRNRLLHKNMGYTHKTQQ